MLNDSPGSSSRRDPKLDHNRQDEMDGSAKFSALQATFPPKALFAQWLQWYIESNWEQSDR
jgi:hypothetical protein